jgi:type III pantothenate kinase
MASERTLVVDIGNTEITAGITSEDGVSFSPRFRLNNNSGTTADELGLSLRLMLKEHNVEISSITGVATASVVPSTLQSFQEASRKYLNHDPFVLTAATAYGISINYKNPNEVGADRLANTLAAQDMFPGENCIVVDFGTAITFDVIRADATYLGGIILPGPRLAMESLFQRTAKLPAVAIVRPPSIVGDSTVEGIQSGLYFGTIHAVSGCIKQISTEIFTTHETVLTIGTGGFSALFEREGLFHKTKPDLVLHGIITAYKKHKLQT